MNYPGLNYSKNELSKVMKTNYDDLINFITDPVFQKLFSEMMSLQPNERPMFVHKIWLDDSELRRRGLKVPEGILIQTSAFGDRRPTLFCVKKFLPEKYHDSWENVNWTFNNDFEDDEVPFDIENSWRLPLAVNVQNALLVNDIDLQSIEDDHDTYSQKLDGSDLLKSQKQTAANPVQS
ncbi:hypothetical protein [Zobellia laminariae]|uniref:hypothetical protein n=1 Tax=Zobellia laminariae TaxID=248906 RepID=UPI003EF6B777